MIYNNFKTKENICAFDTEARLLVKGEVISSKELETLNKPIAWHREFTKVDVYAWNFGTDEQFCFCKSFESFMKNIQKYGVTKLWCYNAKYDFAHIDYYILNDGWNLKHDFEEIEPFTYESLHSEKGMRYKLTLYMPCMKDNKDYYKLEIYDLFNFFNYGLNNVMKHFNINLQKIEGEDYQEGASIEYMKIDIKGLYLCVMKYDAFLRKEYDVSILDKRQSILTIGGLAKRLMLTNMYNCDYKKAIKIYQQRHPINYNLDEEIRKHGLYRGGICIVNSKYQNKIISKQVYKYDVNSMYPYIMSTMADFSGCPKEMQYSEYLKIKDKENYIVICCVSSLYGELLKDKIPIYYCHMNKEYTAYPFFEEQDKQYYIFEEELKELSYWYDLHIVIDKVIIMRKCENIYFKRFVEKFYKKREETKQKGDIVGNQNTKLILNSAYGKIAENPRRLRTHREINDRNFVSLIHDYYEINTKTILNVIQGAYVTSLARTYLLQMIRTICKENVRDNFIYCDTDSIHTFNSYEHTHATRLGALDCEGVYNYCKYIAPKTYFNVLHENGEIKDKYFVAKGIPSRSIHDAVKNKNIEEINEIFAVGKYFNCLLGLNLQGGKALIPHSKTICDADDMTFVLYDELKEETIQHTAREKIIFDKSPLQWYNILYGKTKL